MVPTALLLAGCAPPPTVSEGGPASDPAPALDGQFGDEGTATGPTPLGRVVVVPGARWVAGGVVDAATLPVQLVGDGVDSVRLGYGLAAADVDGDGVPDLVAGTLSGGDDLAAKAIVVPGDRLLDPALTLVDRWSTVVTAFPGRALRSLPDLDGDGKDEVGTAPYAPEGSSVLTSDVVHRVFHGADLAAGLALDGNDAWLRLDGAAPNFGHVPATSIGDLDGDLLPELVIDVPGALRVILGADVASGGIVTADPLAGALVVDLGAGSLPLDLVDAGDVDGDGLHDLAVVVVDTGGLRMAVFSGQKLVRGGTLPLDEALVTVLGPTTELGWLGVTALGDLDADGLDDLGIRSGSDGTWSGGWLSGATLAAGGVIAENAWTRGPVSFAPCDPMTDVFGWLLPDATTDLDGDGLRDWLLTGRAGACVHLGQDLLDLGWDGVPHATVEVALDGGFVPSGGAATAVGDLDGDGIPEVAIGFPEW